MPLTQCANENCQKWFEAVDYANKSYRPRRFCSHKCYWEHGRVVVTCAGCGKQFVKQKTQCKEGRRDFCSKRCAYNNYEKPKHQITVTCEYCQKTFEKFPGKHNLKSKHHFCSRECHHLWQETGNPTGIDHPEYNSVAVLCDNCGKSLLREPYRLRDYKQQFCDMKCLGEWRSKNTNGPNHPRWRGGYLPGYRGPNWARQAALARRRDHYKCRNCGAPQVELDRKLHVHHIVPFREFGYIPDVNDHYLAANLLANLVSLCHSCHPSIEMAHDPRFCL